MKSELRFMGTLMLFGMLVFSSYAIYTVIRDSRPVDNKFYYEAVDLRGIKMELFDYKGPYIESPYLVGDTVTFSTAGRYIILLINGRRYQGGYPSAIITKVK